MNDAELMQAVLVAYNAFKAVVPIYTGNMRYNATQIGQYGNGMYVIAVDGGIAPYAVYTNEPWISPKWNGKSNPNEGWIESGVELMATIIAQTLGGRLVKH